MNRAGLEMMRATRALVGLGEACGVRNCRSASQGDLSIGPSFVNVRSRFVGQVDHHVEGTAVVVERSGDRFSVRFGTASLNS